MLRKVHPAPLDNFLQKEDELGDQRARLARQPGGRVHVMSSMVSAEDKAERDFEKTIDGLMLRKGVLRRPRLGLHEAIQRGQHRVVKQICSERVGLTSIDESSLVGVSDWNETPLMVACQAYHLPKRDQLMIIDYLLQAGAQLDLRDKAGRTPLALAVLAAPDDSRYNRVLPPVLPRYAIADNVLVRYRQQKGRVVWRAATISATRDTLLSEGGTTTVDVQFVHDLSRVNNVPLPCVCSNTKPTDEQLALGNTVLHKEPNNQWTEAIICGQNFRGGFDIRRANSRHASEEDIEAGRVIVRGCRRRDLRFPPQAALGVRRATEGELYPGRPIAVLMPNWFQFRLGMLQGRTDLEGGFNVLLRDKINPATGAAENREPLQCLKMLVNNKRRIQTPWLQRIVRHDRWSRISRRNSSSWTDNSSDQSPRFDTLSSMTSTLLRGVPLECLRIPPSSLLSLGSSCPEVIQRLSKPRRLAAEGLFVTQDEVTDEKWRKQEDTERGVPRGLAGSQAVAIAARQSNLAALRELRAVQLIEGPADLNDNVDGQEARDLVADPEVADFFIENGCLLTLARVVWLAYSGGLLWLDVVRKAMAKCEQTPFMWTSTFPMDSGLDAVGWACKYGRLDLLEELLKHRCVKSLVKQPCRLMQHPVYVALKAKTLPSVKEQLVELLLDNGVPLEEGQLLNVAVEEDLDRLVRLLLRRGASVANRAQLFPPQTYAQSPGVVSTLAEHMGSRVGILPVAIVRKILNAAPQDRDGWIEHLNRIGGDWNAWDDSGHTALTLAVVAEDLQLVNLLTSTGRCNPNVRTAGGPKVYSEYPIGLACGTNKDTQVTEALLRNDVVFLRGTYALPRVCQRGHSGLLRVLLDFYERRCQAGDPNAVNLEETMDGKTPVESLLDRALREPSDDIKSMVLRLSHLKVNINPARIAALGWLDVLNEALTRADGTRVPPVPTPGQRSAMMQAIAKGDDTMVTLLVDSKADLLQTDEEGKTVLVMAIEAPLKHLRSAEDRELKREAILKILINEDEAASLIQANGVLAAAAKRNSLRLIQCLNDKVAQRGGVWSEEDEMDVDPVTHARTSPVALATDQRVVSELIEKNGFVPNVAELAKDGKYRLLLRAIGSFQTRYPRPDQQQWDEFLSQRSSASSRSGNARSALGWILPRRHTLVKDAIKRDWVESFRYYDAAVLTRLAPSCKQKAGAWVRGYARNPGPACTEDGWTGLLEWATEKNRGPFEVVGIEEIIVQRGDAELEPGKAVLIQVAKLLERSRRSPAPSSPVAMWDKEAALLGRLHQRVFLVDSVSPHEWLVTTEPIRKRVSEAVVVRDPVRVSSSDVVPYSRLSDDTDSRVFDVVSNDLAPHLSRHFVDSDGVSILEFAARSGELQMVEKVVKLFPSKIRPRPASASIPAKRLRASSGVADQLMECCEHPGPAALCAAAAGRKKHIVEYLLGNAFARWDDSNHSLPAGTWAASQGVIRVLLEHAKRASADADTLYHNFDTCLMARRGWTLELEELLDLHVSLVPKDPSRGTPLMEAAAGGHRELFQLLSRDHDLAKAFDTRGRSALTVLVQLKDHQKAVSMVSDLFQRFDARESFPERSHRGQSAVQGRRCTTMLIPKSQRCEKEDHIAKSKALCVAIGQNRLNVELIELLLKNGAKPDEVYEGKAAIRHISSANLHDTSVRCEQEQVGRILLRRLLTWKVQVTEQRHELYEEVGDVVVDDHDQERYLVRFSYSNNMLTEWLNKGDVQDNYKGPAACGKLLHADFMHVVSMYHPALVGMMVELDVLEGYYARSLPYVCKSSLRAALLQCLKELTPKWEKEKDRFKLNHEDFSDDLNTSTLCTEQDEPAWAILVHILRGLYRAHAPGKQISGNLTLQQAVFELLDEENDALSNIPLRLYWDVIRAAVESDQCSSTPTTDKTFYSDLFRNHQYELKRHLCLAYNKRLQQKKEPPAILLRTFQALCLYGPVHAAVTSPLEFAVEYAWFEAVRWLVEKKGEDANETQTTETPIRVAALEISKLVEVQSGEWLMQLIDQCDTFSSQKYVELMRDRDEHHVRYSSLYSLDDAILHACQNSRRMKNLVRISLLLLSHGANAEPEDLARLSKVMRLDQTFTALLADRVVNKVTLLHIAAWCNNHKAVKWLLENDAYRDTIGVGTAEDEGGETARYYTTSHACHLLLAKREQEQHKVTGYMPPSDKIDLVIALRINNLLVFDIAKAVRSLFSIRSNSGSAGISTLLHALNALDLAGFVVESESDGLGKALKDKMRLTKELSGGRRYSTKTNEPVGSPRQRASPQHRSQDHEKDVYIVVSGTEKRQRLTCTRYPFLRSSQPSEPLLTKEEHVVSAHLVNSFSWPILDMKLQSAVQAIEEAARLANAPDYKSWVATGDWLNYGYEVSHPLRIRVICPKDHRLNDEFQLRLRPTEPPPPAQDVNPLEENSNFEITRLLRRGKWRKSQAEASPAGGADVAPEAVAEDEGAPAWVSDSGRVLLRPDRAGRWALFLRRGAAAAAAPGPAAPANPLDDEWESVARCVEQRAGRTPTAKPASAWERKDQKVWKKEEILLTEVTDDCARPTWEIVDWCNDLVYAVMVDRTQAQAGHAMNMARKLKYLVATLPDGAPQSIAIESHAFPDITGTYNREEEPSDQLSWSWVSETGFYLKATFLSNAKDGPEATAAGSQKEAGLGSFSLFWHISRRIRHAEADKEEVYLEMHSEKGRTPWQGADEECGWVNSSSKTSVPAISFTPRDSPALAPAASRLILERKARAMWGARQVFAAAGYPQEELPFKVVARLIPDTPCVYKPPSFDTAGHLPPGQKFLELLLQEGKIAQVFGVHDSFEANDVLAEWQPDYLRHSTTMSSFVVALLQPWLWQPYASLSDFLFESTEATHEKKFDPTTHSVCERKAFLTLSPPESHTSDCWDLLHTTQQTVARAVPIFPRRIINYYELNPQEAEKDCIDHLVTGDHIVVMSTADFWAEVKKESRVWWLPVTNLPVDPSSCEAWQPDQTEGTDVPLSTTLEGDSPFLMKIGDRGNVCLYRALRDTPYYIEDSHGRFCPGSSEPLRRGKEVEVLHLDLPGRMARVNHHANRTHFKDYHMPLHTHDKRAKILKLPYLGQLSKLDQYLGSKTAFYFAFTATYCSYLLLLLVSGVIFTAVQVIVGLWDSEKVIIWNTVLVITWGTVFNIRWRRKATELAYLWRVRNVEQWEPPMAAFLKRNVKLAKRSHPITGILEPNFTHRHRRPRIMFSVFITGVLAAVVIMVSWFNVLLRDTYAKNSFAMKLAFGVENAITVAIMDVIYTEVAERLNDFENHRTKSAQRSSKIVKNFVSRFINGFSGLMITVLSNTTEICDCSAWPDCDDPACIRPEGYSHTAATSTCDVDAIRRCTSVQRQRDLMVQLTTQLIVQTILSVVVEKLLPKVWFDARQTKKKQARKEFPDVLTDLALEHVPLPHEFAGPPRPPLTLKRDAQGNVCGYIVAATGIYKGMRANNYCGEWVAEGAETDVRYLIEADDTALKVTKMEGSMYPSLDAGCTIFELKKEVKEVLMSKEAASFWYSIRRIPGNTDALVVVETEGGPETRFRKDLCVLEGFTSPASDIPLTDEDRGVIGIPSEASHQVWMYQLSCEVTLNDNSLLDAMMAKGAKLAHATGNVRKQLTAEIAGLKLLTLGGYAYLDRNTKITSVFAISPVSSEEEQRKYRRAAVLRIDSHVPWRPEFTRKLWRNKRFKTVTVPFLRDKGVRYYCWLVPFEELEGEIAGEPQWRTSTAGAFVYLFNEADNEVEPPEAHKMDRMFPISHRQTDSTQQIVMETLKPHISEESEFNDYTMMMLQFSYVVCFAPVLPLAPLVALITGTIELHTDIYKFLRLAQRPEAGKASGIGAWLDLFGAIIRIAIPINTLIVIRGHGWRYYYPGSTDNKSTVIAFFVIAGFLFVVVRMLNMFMWPIAYWVSRNEVRKDYERLQDENAGGKEER